MAEKKIGKVIRRQALSDLLELFRMASEDGSRFPEYTAGQYIALSRDNCKLTKKVVGPHGELQYAYDTDESGSIKRGTVTHSYSVSSAPCETAENGFLEFYVVLEVIENGFPGRLSESLFKIDPENDNKLYYMNKIVGDFTLEKRAAGFSNVVMVGTGTGLAPFASMIKQLHYEACNGSRHQARFTLFHANRTFAELGYHKELQSIAAQNKFDFMYVPSVSRPTQRDTEDQRLGTGRANNLLRFILDMPLKEEQTLHSAVETGSDIVRAKKALELTVRPSLPRSLSKPEVLQRLAPDKTVVLTCGNPRAMEDVQYIAEQNKLKFEKEDW